MTDLYPISDESGDKPVWKCPLCGRTDDRYYVGGRAAIDIHISRAHREDRTPA